MNIFVLNENPYVVSDLLDKHIVKMPLETSQLLCTVSHAKGIKAVYKPTHRNHPATIWVSKSCANWSWLCIHGLSLCKEYTRRYGKIHKCEAIIKDLQDRTQEIWCHVDDYRNHSEFVQCMPDQYKRSNAVEAYRAYYIGEKYNIATWKYPSKIPFWFKK